MDDYQNLKPWVKEGIVHRIGQAEEPSKVASRYLEVKYTMHDKLYPEVDEMGEHNIDEDGIAKTLLPYIKSLYEIYMRIYPKDKFKEIHCLLGHSTNHSGFLFECFLNLFLSF